MSDNLVPEPLSAIRSGVTDVKADLREGGQRLTTLEIQVGNRAAAEQGHYGSTMQRLNRQDVRLDRIEHRLDLVGSPA